MKLVFTLDVDESLKNMGFDSKLLKMGRINSIIYNSVKLP